MSVVMANSFFWPEYTFNTDRNDLLHRIFSASPVHRNFSEWRLHFRMPFHIQNAVCNMECRLHSEDRVPVSERWFGFRILRFIFRISRFYFRMSFVFQNVVYFSELRWPLCATILSPFITKILIDRLLILIDGLLISLIHNIEVIKNDS